MYTYSAFHRHLSEQRKESQIPENNETTVPPSRKHVCAMLTANNFTESLGILGLEVIS